MWLLSIIMPIISPVIFIFVSKGSPFVVRNCIHSLFFHICMVVLIVLVKCLAFVSFGLLGFLMYIPALLQLAIPIVAAIAANNGRVYQPPISGPFTQRVFRS